MKKVCVLILALLSSSRGLVCQTNDIQIPGRIQSLALETGEIEILMSPSTIRIQNMEANLLDQRGEALAKIMITFMSSSMLKARILSYYQTGIVAGIDVIVLVKRDNLDALMKGWMATAEQDQGAGRMATALENLEKVLAVDAANTQAIEKIQAIGLQLAAPLIRKGDFEAALGAIERGLKHCQENSLSCAKSREKKAEILGLRSSFNEKTKRIDALLAEHKTAEAESLLNSLLQLHPDNLELQKKRTQATNLTQARASQKNETQRILRTTERMVAKKEYRGALKYLEQYEKDYPESKKEFDELKLDIYIKIGDLFFLGKNYRQSLFWLEKGLSLFPSDAKIKSAYQKSKASLIADLMGKGESQYRLRNYRQSQDIFKEVCNLDPSHAKSREMINECQYQMYIKDADNNYAVGNLDIAMPIYRKAYELFPREYPHGRIASILRRLMQRAMASDVYDSYENNLAELMAIRDVSPNLLEASKAELRDRIRRLSGSGDPRSDRWLGIAQKYFPEDDSYFAIPIVPKEAPPSPQPLPAPEKKPTDIQAPQDIDRPIPEYPSRSERKKTSLSKQRGQKSFFYAGLAISRPPDPAFYYADAGSIARIGDSGDTAIGGGVGLVIGLSRWLFADLSVNYGTHKLSYEYEEWDPFYGTILMEGEMTNSLINYALTLNLSLAPLYIGGGGNYTVMSPSKSNISFMQPSTNLTGFGYHFGAGLMLVKNMIWIDYKRIRASLSTPGGTKNMDFDSVNVKFCLAF